MSEKRKPPNAGKGRVKGVPNKATATARKVMQMVADGRGEDFIRWMDETAAGLRGKKGWTRAPNPEGAARLYLQRDRVHGAEACAPRAHGTRRRGDSGDVCAGRQGAVISRATHLMLEGGSRSGKTFLNVRNVVMRALKAQRSRHLVVRFGSIT
jgi:hypothetical protein